MLFVHDKTIIVKIRMRFVKTIGLSLLKHLAVNIIINSIIFYFSTTIQYFNYLDTKFNYFTATIQYLY